MKPFWFGERHETEDRGQERRLCGILRRHELARALLEVGEEAAQVLQQSLAPTGPSRVVHVEGDDGEDRRQGDEKLDGAVASIL